MKPRLLSLSIAVALLSGPPSLVSAADRPNIVVIMADDMGYSDLGCYGGEIRTPNLDALARNGLRYDQFYNTARCWPSRAALMTGYYAQQVRRDALPGLGGGGQGVRPDWAKLLPDLLKSAGYRSYHSGKWHIDGKPLANGFDHSYSLDDHDRHFYPKAHTEDGKPLPAVDPKSGYYTSDAIAEHAIKCLREHAADHRDRPFLSFVAFTAPHFPVQAPPEDIARYKDRYKAGWDELRKERRERMRGLGIGGEDLSAIEREIGPPYAFPEAIKKLGPNELNRPLPWSELSPAQRDFQAAKMAVHAAMVDRMDQRIGRIVDQLKSMGVFENTLIFVMSDNGASAEIMVRGDGHDQNAPAGSGATFLSIGPGWSSLANTPFRRHKTWVHEGGIATPLIVHWPKGIAAKGEIRHAPGHLIDIVPTVLEVAGTTRPTEHAGKPVPVPPGKSLVKSFASDAPIERPFLWWLHEGNKALRVGDWKIVAAKGEPWSLHDLKTDRAESHDLAAKHPEKVRELAALWQKQVDEYSAVLGPAPAAATKAAKGKTAKKKASVRP